MRVTKDDIGRMFCANHGRETCHQCCMDFAQINRMAEVKAELRVPDVQATAETL